MKMNTYGFGLLFLVYFIIQYSGAPRFANYLQDHMVLQRAPQRAIVWGFGNANTLTILTMNNRTYTTVSRSELANDQNESIWSVTLDPVEEEGPFDINVTQTSANQTHVTITLHDVLFGDVWLCSGQSNMHLVVSMIYNATEEIVNADKYPKVRVFSTALLSSLVPVEELLGIVLNWSLPSARSIGGPTGTFFSAVCWLYGRMIHAALDGRPIGLISTSYGGTFIEVWMPPEALQDCNTTSIVSQNNDIAIQAPHYLGIPTNHSSLYNSMIYPFMRMVIHGVIWYQGESNSRYNVDKYACSFAKLIQYWRRIWHERTNGTTNIEFPFGFVQISTDTNDTTKVAGFPWIRWHQTFDIGYVPNDVVPKVFMAVSLDLRDDPNGIHPRYKHDVGYRLSRAGLAIAYERNIEYRGPIVQNVTYSSGSQTINITYKAVSKIELRNRNGFEVCCLGNQCLNDTIWIPSTISKLNNLTITLTVPSSCAGQQLYGLRYLWHETPCPFKQAAIYSGTDSNLPSPSYLKPFS